MSVAEEYERLRTRRRKAREGGPVLDEQAKAVLVGALLLVLIEGLVLLLSSCALPPDSIPEAWCRAEASSRGKAFALTCDAAKHGKSGKVEPVECLCVVDGTGALRASCTPLRCTVLP